MIMYSSNHARAAGWRETAATPVGRLASGPPRSPGGMTRCFLIVLLSSALSVLSEGSFAGVLHDAAKAGDLEQVQRLVVEGVDVNEGDKNGETPLIVASLEGQGEIANYLLQRGARIDATNASGLSALHAAAYGGHTDIARLLIAKGAAVNDSSNRFGVTPLHLAAEENHIQVVELLLKSGAEVDRVERNGYTPLTRAGWREHWEIVKLLLASGARCQPSDKVGEWLYKECSTRAAVN